LFFSSEARARWSFFGGKSRTVVVVRCDAASSKICADLEPQIEGVLPVVVLASHSLRAPQLQQTECFIVAFFLAGKWAQSGNEELLLHERKCRQRLAMAVSVLAACNRC
jgi:hypothetical protein